MQAISEVAGLAGAGRTDPTARLSARQALARANGIVDQDRRNHSPDCVAVDQKLVDKAQLQMAEAQSAANAGGLNLVV